MPHSVDTAANTAADIWRAALRNAQKHRLEAEKLVKPLRELAIKHRASSDAIAEIAVNLRVGDIYDKDPLVIRYVELLLKHKIITASSLLTALLRSSRFSSPDATINVSSTPLPTFEEKAFILLKDNLAITEYPAATWKVHALIHALTRWLHAVSAYELAQQLELGALHTTDVATSRLYESLGLLTYHFIGHRHFREVERQPWWKPRRSQVASELKKFDLHVLMWIHSPLAGHLQALTQARPFLETDDKGRPVFTREQILTMHSDLTTINSRAGLFVWLTAAFYAQPLTEDATMRNYLMVRYHEDAQTAAVDLILASFDVLTNSVPKLGTVRMQKSVRSFICNKLPLLLLSLSAYMAAGALETCISMALVSINLDPLTPLAVGAAESTDVIKKTRSEFLQACLLHQLVTEATAATISQEHPMVAPKAVKYIKAALLTQCASNTSRLDSLSQELDGVNGNAGAIAGCIVDLVNNLCASKDTMTLKTVCSILLKRIPSMDTLLQYAQPSSILLPLANLLNDWVHDQDQTEYQPPYEEFAVILLYTLALIFRYDLSPMEIGLATNEHFIARLLQARLHSTPISNLNQEQSEQLAYWAEGLYATDEHGETVGITDEVYSHCPPQAFYLLAPTLFEQTTLACKSKALSIKTIKGGLEFLSEPFLLPSLVPGLNWMIEHLWQNPQDADILLQLLDSLLKPSSTSPEAQVMHKAILAIVSDRLERCLQELLRKRPEKKKDIGVLIELLRPHTGQQRTVLASKAQLEAFSSLDEGGLASRVRSSIRDLTTWAASGGTEAPPKFTPCSIWGISLILGAQNVLEIIVDELKDQTAIGNGSIAIDVCTAIISAPEQDTYTPLIATILQTNSNRMTLRDCLRLIIADSKTLLELPHQKAEAIIRLSRRVEAQLSVSQMAMASLSLPTQESTDQVMQDLGLSAGDASLNVAAVIGTTGDAAFDNDPFTAASDPALDLANATTQELNNMVAGADLMSIDQSQDIFGDFSMDLSAQTSQIPGLGGDASTADLNDGQNPDEDIFAELDMRNLGEDFSFA